MPISGDRLNKANALLELLEKRKKMWDDHIEALTTGAASRSMAATPLKEYENRLKKHQKEKKIAQQQAKRSDHVRTHFSAAEHRLGDALAHADGRNAWEKVSRQKKHEFDQDTDLGSLYGKIDRAQAFIDSAKGRLITVPHGNLNKDYGFFRKLESELAKGHHDKALKMLDGKNPGRIRGFLMGHAEAVQRRADIAKLRPIVEQHQEAYKMRDRARNTAEIVEKETAKAICEALSPHTLLKIPHPLKGREITKLLDPGNHHLEELARTNSTAALLWDNVRSHPNESAIIAVLSAKKNISLQSIQDVMNQLHADFIADHAAARTNIETAEQGVKDCKDYIRNCRAMKGYELSIPNHHFTRDELIIEVKKRIDNASSLEDKDIDPLLDTIEDRRIRHWATMAESRDIEADVDNLAHPATFNHSTLHQSSLEHFNFAADGLERLGAVLEPVVHAPANVYHHFTP